MAHARDGGGHEDVAEATVCLDGDSEAGEARGAGRVPPWRGQLTARGMVASLAVGAMYSAIVMKLGLTTGLVPTLNVSAALIAFVILRGWTQALARFGIATRPFTRQENTVVQTCAVACYSIATGGGFGSFLLGLNKRTYEMAGEETEGSEEEITLLEFEEAEEGNPQEDPQAAAPEGVEQNPEELPECPDHRPTSFLRDGTVYHGYCKSCFYPAVDEE